MENLLGISTQKGLTSRPRDGPHPVVPLNAFPPLQAIFTKSILRHTPLHKFSKWGVYYLHQVLQSWDSTSGPALSGHDIPSGLFGILVELFKRVATDWTLNTWTDLE